jgi:hypothetical protein
MKAWQLDRLGGELTLRNVPTPQPRPGSVQVRIEASLLMSYLKSENGLKYQMQLPGAVPASSERRIDLTARH